MGEAIAPSTFGVVVVKPARRTLASLRAEAKRRGIEWGTIPAGMGTIEWWWMLSPYSNEATERAALEAALRETAATRKRRKG